MNNRTNAMIYKELAFKIICECIKTGKFKRPNEGSYHLVGIDFGLKRHVFYRVTRDHVETVDRPTTDILDRVYCVDHTTLKVSPDSKVNYEKWRHFELTN